MGGLLNDIQQRTTSSGRRIWDSEPYAVAMAGAQISAARRAQTVKLLGLVAVGGLGWFVAGPLLAGPLAIAWFLFGFRCIDAYYSGWLESTVCRLVKEAEAAQRIASMKRTYPEAASLIDSAKKHLADAHKRRAAGAKGSFGDMSVNALLMAFNDAAKAAHWFVKGVPAQANALAQTPDFYAFFQSIGLGETDGKLYLTLCNASSLDIPKPHFDFLADAVATLIGRVERL